MQTTSSSFFSTATLTNLFSGRRNKSDAIAFPDNTDEGGNHQSVGFVRMAKLSSSGSDSEKKEEETMSVAPATKGPPLPARGPPLPPRNSSTLPPLPSAHRRGSVGPPAQQRGSIEPPPPHRDLPPPPPRRNTSLSTPDNVSEFEARFRFHPLSHLPPPEPFSEGRRTYPSEMPKTSSTGRDDRDSLPPPPPPSLPPPPPPR